MIQCRNLRKICWNAASEWVIVHMPVTVSIAMYQCDSGTNQSGREHSLQSYLIPRKVVRGSYKCLHLLRLPKAGGRTPESWFSSTWNRVMLLRFPSSRGREPVKLLLFTKLLTTTDKSGDNLYKISRKVETRVRRWWKQGTLLKAWKTSGCVLDVGELTIAGGSEACPERQGWSRTCDSELHSCDITPNNQLITIYMDPARIWKKELERSHSWKVYEITLPKQPQSWEDMLRTPMTCKLSS